MDEPFGALDEMTRERLQGELLSIRSETGAAVVFVTHELNPVLPVVDRVIHFAGGRALVGTPDEVMTSESLSDLYGSPVEVIRRGERIIVVGADDAARHHHVHDHAEGEPV